jgi:long-chain acyl-CoA synthetase
MTLIDPGRPPTLSSVLEQNARKHPNKLAIASGDVQVTWAELTDRVERLANVLADGGFGRGDRLLWMGQTSHRVLEALLAASHLGGMVAPVNWRQSAAEQSFVLADFDPKVVLWQDEAMSDVVEKVRSITPSCAQWIQHDGHGPQDYEALLKAGAPARAAYSPDEDDPVLVIYTAGFDGHPNGALITHRNMLSQSMLMAWLQDIGPSSVWLAPGPLFHIGNWITAIPTFVMGGTNVFTRTTDAELMCEAVDRYGCTHGYVLPAVVTRMVEANRDGRYDLSTLCSSVDDPEWQSMVRPDESPWGRKLSFFGQTEVFGIVTHAEFGGHREGYGSTGTALPFADVRIVDDDDVELPQGEVGEIVVRGQMVCKGYWNRPDLNAERTRSGWWHTRDLGRIEPDGSLLFVGPKTRMLKSGNENIYPAELERCLRRHAAVREAAVIGVPHEMWTQVVKAVLVLHEGATVSEDEVIAWCRQHVAGYKRPHSVELMSELPRTASGAVDYDALDERFGGGGYPGGTTRVR